MIVSFSGHRAGPKIGGYKIPNPTYNYICQETEKLLLELKPDKCISGGAIGYDQWAAFVCMRLDIPVVFAVPHIGQEKIWPKENQELYHKLLKKAVEVVIVSSGVYSPEKMQIRNEYLVDRCDELIACWSGDNGGTKNCVEYARGKDKKIHIINPNIERQ